MVSHTHQRDRSGIANAAQQWCPQHNEQSGITNAAQQKGSERHCKCRSTRDAAQKMHRAALQMPLSSCAAQQNAAQQNITNAAQQILSL
jgi:hypothetical protein